MQQAVVNMNDRALIKVDCKLKVSSFKCGTHHSQTVMLHARKERMLQLKFCWQIREKPSLKEKIKRV